MQAQSEQGPGGWRVGGGVVAVKTPYASNQTRVLPVPLAFYEGERFFFRGGTFGAHLLQTPAFTVDASLALRLDGIKADKFDRAQLLRQGVDPAIIRNRKDSLDLGVSAQWRTEAGIISGDVKRDVTNTSDGHELGLTYAYPIPYGQTLWLPQVGVRRQSTKMANYYLGTWDDEIERGAPAYRPGAFTAPHFGITLARPLGQRWAFIGSAKIEYLPREITRSPLASRDSDVAGSLMLGISRDL